MTPLADSLGVARPKSYARLSSMPESAMRPSGTATVLAWHGAAASGAGGVGCLEPLGVVGAGRRAALEDTVLDVAAVTAVELRRCLATDTRALVDNQ
jgi:hypothetical protein